MISFVARRLRVVTFVGALAAASVASAQTVSTWTGLAALSNNWTNGANWDTDPTVPVGSDMAVFNGAGNGNTSISLGGATQPISSILFDTASAASYTIGQTTGDALSFNDGSKLWINPGVTTAQIINAALLTNGSMSIHNTVSNGAAGGGDGVIGLTLGNINFGTAGNLAIDNGIGTVANVTTKLNGNITETPGQPGSLTLTATTPGASNNNNFIINGNNSYTGGTTIQANTGNIGSIQIGTDMAFGTGKITTQSSVNSGEIRALNGTRTIANAIDLNQGLSFAGTNSIVLSGPIAIASGASRTLTSKITGPGTLSLGASPGSSTIYLGNPATSSASTIILSATSGATMIVNDVFQDVDATSSSSAVRYGTAAGGNIIINALQTYTSPTQLGDGSATVQFHHDYNVGDPSGPFGLGTLIANGGSNTQLAPTGGGTRTIANPLRMVFGLTVAAIAGDTTNLTFTGPITFNSAASRLLQNLLPSAGGTLTLGSAASPSTFTLASTAGLTLTFQGGGKTVINDVIQDSPGFATNITINTGTTITFNGAQNTNGNWTISANNAKVAINALRTGTGNTTLSGSGAAALIGVSSNALPGPSFTAGPFGSGTVTVNNTTTAPILQPIGADRTVANAINMTSGFTVSNATGTSFSLNLTGPITLGATSNSLTNNLVSGAALTLGDAESPSTLSLGSTLTIQTQTAGGGMTTINDAVTGTGGLNVQNSAVVQMNNANNNYSGTTTVTGTGSPKLLVNGSKTGSGAVLIDSTGTLGGTSSIAGDVGNAGTIAPGTSVGTLTMTNNVTMGANSHLAIELSGTAADKLVVGGNLDLSAAEFLDVTGAGSGSSWVIATYGGTLTGTFENITPGYTVDYGTGSNSLITLMPGLPGDYNNNGTVDAGDYVVWRKGGDLANDPTPGVQPEDYTFWRSRFGASTPGSGSAINGGESVPEPATLVLLMFATSGWCFWGRRAT